ncbi:MAG: hypothetical protein KAS63_08910 [Candidatus Heimdallarchaeota archaeon]|nr:hypothetical protein [Candidatus Heimdallarchaeota archaeon]MCK4955468.1 hypothetical protein [Candidatus Heimdallarchaeota archaeon]
MKRYSEKLKKPNAECHLVLNTIWFWSLIVLLSTIVIVWFIFAAYRGLRYEIFEVIGFIFLTLALSLNVGEYQTFSGYQIAASIVALIASFFIIIGLVSSNRRWVKRKGTTKLNEFSNLMIFAYLRHPITLGLIFISFSTILLANSILSNIFSVIAVIVFVIASLEKDSFLQKIYGYPYKFYMKKVPRFNIIHGILRSFLARKEETDEMNDK